MINLTKIGIGTTHGKVILMGEHSVVYGQPAITIPLLTLPTVAKVIKTNEDQSYIDSGYYKGPLEEAPKDLQGIKNLIELLIKDLPISSNIIVQIESSLPIERGMGSSAATGAAITKAMFSFVKEKLDRDTLFHYTNFSEKIIHGTPSGVDAATVISKKPIYFIKNRLIKSFHTNINGYLIIIDSGVKGNTGEAVHDLRILKNEHPNYVNTRIKKLGNLTNKSKATLKDNELNKLGKIFNHAQKILRELKISNQTIDELVSTANTAGSLGTKITGGGRGGCIIALADSFEKANKIAEIAKNKQAENVWIQPLNI